MIEAAHNDAGVDWSRVRKALLIRLRSIGDTVLMTPCLAALKAFRPDIETTVLMEPLSASLLEDHPLVDRLIVADKSIASRARALSKLRAERLDVAFNMHGGATATILAAMSGARHTLGYRGHPKSFMLTSRAPSPDLILGRTKVHSVEQQLALLKWAGVAWPSSRPSLHLAVNCEAESTARERLRANRLEPSAFAVIAPAAAYESKTWRADGFARVTEHLRERWDLPSAVIAGPGQEKIAQEVAAQSRSRPAVITGLSLKELMALLCLARIFIGNDSGPMHIAAAFKRPVVAVFGSSSPSVWHPWTDLPYAVVRHQKEFDSQEKYGIKHIPAHDAVAAVDEVLEKALEAGRAADAGLQTGLAKK